MTAEELREIIACGETSKVQFKLMFNTPKQIAEEMVAFANSKGGMIVFGVEDKTGQIVGLSYSEIQKLSNEVSTVANDQVRPVIYLETEVVIVDGKRLLIAHVHEGSNKPYKTLGGNIWVKQGPDKRRIVENNEILSLFQASGSYHADEAVIAGTSVADLEVAYINDYFQKVYGKPKESFGMPVDKLLTSLGILGNGGQVTRAGMLFFGQYPQMRMPTYVIKAVAYYGNDIGGSDYRDSRDIIGTVPMMFREGMSFLKSNLRHLQAGQNFNSVGKLEIPEVVLEELLQNALVHVDLLGSAYIRLLVFDNRIEIINPGSLFGGLTVEDIRLGKSKQRNQLMADFCARTMIYRGLGSGIPRVLKEDAKIDFVSDDNTGDFKTIIWRDTNLEYYEEDSEENGSFIAAEGQLYGDSGQLNYGNGQSNVRKDVRKELTERQALIVDLIKSDVRIGIEKMSEKMSVNEKTVRRDINVLKQLGLLTRVGGRKSGCWKLSEELSEKTSN
jgi:predicted HTH transcriptional regulator